MADDGTILGDGLGMGGDLETLPEGGDEGLLDEGLGGEGGEGEGGDGGEGAGEGGDGEGGEGEGEGEGQQQGGKPKEILPAELAKAVRELKQAHPEQTPAIKRLQTAWYVERDYRSVFATPEDARSTKAALEAVGGTDGISRMQSTVDDIEQFDSMMRDGNPNVMDGLSKEFPDGFKKLVPVAMQKLSQLDQGAYREAMRGPLLQMLEGDGLLDVISTALDELKAGAGDQQNMASFVSRAQRELGRILNWYGGLKKEEESFRNRYQDPRVQELETRERQVKDEKAGIVRTNVTRDLVGYLDTTMKPEVTKVLNGRTVSQQGMTRFIGNVKQEVNAILSGNTHYKNTMKNLISRGDIEGAIRFAKPHIDSARAKAVRSVYTDIYGSTPAGKSNKGTNNGTRQNSQQRMAATTTSDGRAIPIAKKPGQDEIDWSKDPNNLLYITGKAYLKGSGKLVTWLPSAGR